MRIFKFQLVFIIVNENSSLLACFSVVLTSNWGVGFTVWAPKFKPGYRELEIFTNVRTFKFQLVFNIVNDNSSLLAWFSVVLTSNWGVGFTVWAPKFKPGYRELEIFTNVRTFKFQLVFNIVNDNSSLFSDVLPSIWGVSSTRAPRFKPAIENYNSNGSEWDLTYLKFVIKAS